MCQGEGGMRATLDTAAWLLPPLCMHDLGAPIAQVLGEGSLYKRWCTPREGIFCYHSAQVTWWSWYRYVQRRGNWYKDNWQVGIGDCMSHFHYRVTDIFFLVQDVCLAVSYKGSNPMQICLRIYSVEFSELELTQDHVYESWPGNAS